MLRFCGQIRVTRFGSVAMAADEPRLADRSLSLTPRVADNGSASTSSRVDDTRNDTPALARFTRDLTADARAGRLEPVRCRDEEISRVIDILLRHGKNNPALVGPAGVGKTAIAEGLAQRIADGQRAARAARRAAAVARPRRAARRHDVSRPVRGATRAHRRRDERRGRRHAVHRRDAQPHRPGHRDRRPRWTRRTCSSPRSCAASSASSARRPTTSTSAGSSAIPRSSAAFRRSSCASFAEPRRWRFSHARTDRSSGITTWSSPTKRCARRSSSPISTCPTACVPTRRSTRSTKRARTRRRRRRTPPRPRS